MKTFSHILFWSIVTSSAIMAGEYADAFLFASIQPQVHSLGNSTVAAVVTSGHALNNPAGFVNGSPAHLAIIYDRFEALTQSVGVEAKYGILENYELGLTIINNSIDNLFARPNLSDLSPENRRDSVLALSGTDLESIKYRESAIFLSIAREYKFDIDLGWVFFKIPCRLPVGASVKYIDKVLEDNRGLGSGIDLGGQFFFNLGGMTDMLVNTEFSLGLLMSDILNTPVYWDTEHQDAIIRQISYGFAVEQNIKKYDSRIRFSKSHHTRNDNSINYGAELSIKNLVFIRGGHDSYTTSFGLGIGIKKFIIDYSFSQHELSDMQKIGISYHF
ncbi:MAG: hypothetical protein K9N35_01935 [Candidatus Marinimicrobia bacterium]|nr:hypothetical protein [Candidatus Neomarinimicrobiota bacterium]